MGQKTNPNGFRLGVIRTWDSKWYEEKNYAKWLHEDLKLRAWVKDRHYSAGIAKVEIERAANKVKVNIFTARPGIVIGKKGAGIDQLKKELQKLTENEVFINIQEIRKAEIDAVLVAENIATQLERRIAFRRAMKKAVTIAMKFGAKGIRVAARAASAAPRCRATSGTARGAFPSTRSAPTSSTAPPSRRPSRAPSVSSAGSSRARSSPPVSRTTAAVSAVRATTTASATVTVATAAIVVTVAATAATGALRRPDRSLSCFSHRGPSIVRP
jgi:ribosomal protein S3